MDKSKLIAIIGATAFLIIGALLQSPVVGGHPQVAEYLQLALTVLGALGFGVTHPVFPRAAKPADKTPPQSTITKIGVMLPLLLLPVLASSCAHVNPAIQDLGQCELDALPSSSGPIIAAIISIVSNPASTVQELLQLGQTPAIKCAVAAVQKWLMGAPHAMGTSELFADSSRDQREHALGVLGAYLAQAK